jgi:hypothetical protein
MRTLLAALALVPAALTLLPGCPLGCGGWEGRGDTLMRSESGDSVMLCANGGFSAMLSTGEVEGVFDWTDEVRASSPATGARAFSMKTDANGQTSSPELGAGWTEAVLDRVELDHAHVQCADLETRPWWGTVHTTAWLPKAAAFKKPATGFDTADACFEAQARGEYPEAALCEDELLACPDGSVKINAGQSFDVGTYDAQYGTLHVRPSFASSFDGVFSASGTLSAHPTYDLANLTVWHQVAVSEMSNGAACL